MALIGNTDVALEMSGVCSNWFPVQGNVRKSMKTCVHAEPNPRDDLFIGADNKY